MSTDIRITFIGGGNMARSLIGGLLQNGFAADRIHVADPSAAQLELLREKFSVHTTADNGTAVREAQLVVFAVKPQVFRDVARPLGTQLASTRPLIISIAAGITESDVHRWLGYDAAIVRVMPNMPALVGAGAAALFANRFVTAGQRLLAETMLNTVGIALWMEDERHMDAVTAVSGCGPAYFFLIMEAMEAAARQLDLPDKVARRLVLQTAYGAARMALTSADDVATLRKQVASPGGTTAAALKVLEDAHLRRTFLQALIAARDRGAELSRDFGREPP